MHTFDMIGLSHSQRLSLHKFLIFILLAFIAIGGCVPGLWLDPGEAAQEWQYANLRWLDSEVVETKGANLIASYVRCSAQNLELRADLLTFDDPWSLEIQIFFDLQPGRSVVMPDESAPWDMVITVSNQEDVQVNSQDQKLAELKPRLIKDVRMDFFEIRLPESPVFCKVNNRFQIRVSKPGTQIPSDQTDVFGFGDRPPPASKVLLAFWDSLPSVTPAQSLRRWNGAHTGPFGQRHGLQVLLRSAERFSIPVILLDMMQPSSMSALERLGGNEWLESLQKKGVVGLPFVYPSGYPVPDQTASHVDNFMYAWTKSNTQLPQVHNTALFRPPGSKIIFGHTSDQTQMLIVGNSTALQLPSALPDDLEVDLDQKGFTESFKRELLATSSEKARTDVLIIAESLPSSSWGDAISSAFAFEYISKHPWIHMLNYRDLLSWPSRGSNYSSSECGSWLCEFIDYSSINMDRQDQIHQTLMDASNSGLSQIAWQTYINLTKDTPDLALAKLQAIYLPEVFFPLLADKWAEAPYSISDCNQDVNRDGSLECILASENILLIIDPDGGRLVYGVFRTEEGKPFQVVSSTAQFGVGLSDPSEWNFSAGPRSDPNVVAGGFDDGIQESKRYSTQVFPLSIRLYQEDLQITKEYTLQDSGVAITIQKTGDFNYLLPLVVSPEARFRKQGLALYMKGSSVQVDHMRWGLPDGRKVEIWTDEGAADMITFQDSAGVMQQGEDPNYDYPAGHFLPYPTALVTLRATDTMIVHIIAAN